MLYNSRRPSNTLADRDHPRPQTARHRLLHSGLGHHGGRGLARRHGRLVAARWRTRRRSRLCYRWRLLLPIGWVYGRLVVAMPDAAGEIAYTSAVFPRSVSFATGWMMILAYFIVCPWEAVAVGRIAAYIFPSLDTLELYRIAGRPVYLPHLIIGLALTALLTVLNYRGVRLSATFQNWTTFGTLALFVIFVAARRKPRFAGTTFRRSSPTLRSFRSCSSFRSFRIS